MLEMEHKTGQTTNASLHLVARAVQVDGETAILIVIEDTTARKHAEQLVEAERDQLAGEVRSAVETPGRARASKSGR